MAPRHGEADHARSWWLEVLVLVAFEVVVLHGITHHVDLHPSDEALYQRRGQMLLDLQFDASTLVFAPVYAAAYAPLRLLPLHGAAIQDLMGVVLALASPLALLWTARALVPRPAALLVAAWWGASLPLLASSLRVYLFTTTLTTLAVGLAARERKGAAALLLALAALNRPELLPWLLLAAGCLCWFAVRRRARAAAAATATALAIGLLLALFMARPEFRHRQWFTFRWDYAAHLAPKSEVSYDEDGRSPADALVAAAFPGCRSLADAVRTSPGAVLAHAGRNLRLLPGNLVDLTTTAWWHLPPLRWPLVGAAAVLLLVGLVAGRRQQRARPPGAASAGIVLWSSASVLVPLVLFLPRPDYLMPFGVALLIAAAVGIARGGSALCRRLRVGPGAARHLAVAAVVLATAVVPGPFVRPPATTCPNRDAVALLERQPLRGDAVLFAATADGLRTLSDGRFGTRPLADLMSGAPPPGSFLLVGPWDLLGSSAATVLALLEAQRWRLLDAGAECWLFAQVP